MQRLQIETPEHVVLDFDVAGVGSRALAAVIDMVILTGFAIAAILVFGFGLKLSTWFTAVALFLVATGGFLYFIFFEGFRHGQTPGKRIVGIRVVSGERTGYAFCEDLDDATLAATAERAAQIAAGTPTRAEPSRPERSVANKLSTTSSTTSTISSTTMPMSQAPLR